MPRSLDNALNALDSRLRALRREDGPVLMLDAFRRHLLGEAWEEPASTESRSATATSTQALPQRSPKSSRDRSFRRRRPTRYAPGGARLAAINRNRCERHEHASERNVRCRRSLCKRAPRRHTRSDNPRRARITAPSPRRRRRSDRRRVAVRVGLQRTAPPARQSRSADYRRRQTRSCSYTARGARSRDRPVGRDDHKQAAEPGGAQATRARSR